MRLLKRDLFFVLEKLVSVLDEPRIETLARQHGIRQKRDERGITKTLLAFMRRADEGTLSRLTVEATILLAASRHKRTIYSGETPKMLAILQLGDIHVREGRANPVLERAQLIASAVRTLVAPASESYISS